MTTSLHSSAAPFGSPQQLPGAGRTNGEVGLNTWVEEDGDLLFYIARTDAWSEISRLLKLGRVRVRFSPNPFASGKPFVQELKLREGRIEITAGAPGSRVTLSLFVDARYPVIHVVGQSDQPLTVRTSLEDVAQRETRSDG